MRRMTFLAVAAMALITSGCGSDSTGPMDLLRLGRYRLVSVDGETLPLTLYDDPTLKLTVTSGALTLNSNNSFTEEVHIDVVANGFPAAPELLTCNGTFERSGNSFTMTSTASDECDASTATGTLSGNTLTVDDEGQVLVFRR
jgi:hypothetical protein